MRLAAINETVAGGMTMVQKSQQNGDTYTVPARLVHGTILSIVGSILALAGTVVTWTVNDARHEALQTAEISRIGGHVDNGILSRADQRLSVVEAKVAQNERVLARIEDKLDAVLELRRGN